MTCEVQCDDFLLTDKRVRELLDATCKEKNVEHAEVVVQCVSLEEIQKLNTTYRNKERPTNILTFSYPDSNEHDIAICLPVAEQEAQDLNISLTDYVALLLVHAFLHVVGMDHERSEAEERETAALEQRILLSCGFAPVSLFAV